MIITPVAGPDTPFERPELAPWFFSTLNTVPLKTLNGGSVEAVKNATGENTGYYRLSLSSASKEISEQVSSNDSKGVPVVQKADSAILFLRDEALARRALSLFNDASELCRQNIGPDAGGPSLKETLDWLREKIPLASNHYIFTGVWGGGPTKDVTLRTVPVRFDSCTVSFDLTEVDVWAAYRDRPIVSTTRQVVPLGALTGSRVMKNSIRLSLDSSNKIEKQVEEWNVYLNTASKVILSETHEDLNNSTKSESVNFAFLGFYEESIANRVLEAFKHAAELCRGKEPF